MSKVDSEFLRRVRCARDKLSTKFLKNPDVTFIDIGYGYEGQRRIDKIVLRIHVRERWMKAKPGERVAFPRQIDDIPVIVLLGDYNLEKDEPDALEESNHSDLIQRRMVMGTNEKVALKHKARDDLEAIKGIGPSTSETLYNLGICQFADLASYTPEKLANALQNKAGVTVTPETIEAKNWIGQARRMVKKSKVMQESLQQKNDAKKESRQKTNKKKRTEHASFSIFFDFEVGEHGEKIWQTRVYDSKSGEEEPLKGLDTDLWVNWILKRAKLPDMPATTEEAVSASAPMSIGLYDAKMQIVSVNVSEFKASANISEKKLMAEVNLKLSGTDAEKLVNDRIQFRTEIYTVDLEHRISKLVASVENNLEPKIFEYTSKREFPIPDLKRSEMHTIVQLLPPADMMACHQGPIINVIP